MVKLNLSISDGLKKKLNKKIKETNFNSIEEYVLFMIEQMVGDIKMESSDSPAYTDEEETDLKKRLKELGYL